MEVEDRRRVKNDSNFVRQALEKWELREESLQVSRVQIYR